MKLSIAILLVAWLASGVEALGQVQGWELQGEFESLKPGRSDICLFRVEGGAVVEVPLAALSEKSRTAVRRRLDAMRQPGSADGADEAALAVMGPGGKKVALSVPMVLKDVETDAIHSKTAAEAVRVYRILLADESLSKETRLQAEQRLEYWLKLADQKRVRVGDSWVKPAEAEEIAEKADEMVKHALELLRIGNNPLAGKELEKASKLNPEVGKADFLTALVYALFGNDAKVADHFAEVVRREPGNGFAYNNLAVSEVFVKKYKAAAEHFRRALELMPESQEIADNLAVTIRVAGRGGLRIPDRVLEEMNDVYRMALRDLRLKPLASDRPLTLISPSGKAWDRANKDLFAELGGPTEEAVVSVATGTGFVVAPGCIVTSAHVVAGSADVEVLDPNNRDRQLKAEVVATMDGPDLALLRCPDLDAESLTLAAVLPRRGEEVMVVGYPGGTLLGLERKSAPGAIVSQVQAEIDGGAFVYSATVAPGNGGGPIVDQAGRVVGVVVAAMRPMSAGNSRGVGIPAERVLAFLEDHVPGLQSKEADGQASQWSDINAKVGASTVFITATTKTGRGQAK